MEASGAHVGRIHSLPKRAMPPCLSLTAPPAPLPVKFPTPLVAKASAAPGASNRSACPKRPDSSRHPDPVPHPPGTVAVPVPVKRTATANFRPAPPPAPAPAAIPGGPQRVQIQPSKRPPVAVPAVPEFVPIPEPTGKSPALPIILGTAALGFLLVVLLVAVVAIFWLSPTALPPREPRP